MTAHKTTVFCDLSRPVIRCRGECECGWKGPWYKGQGEMSAAADARVHARAAARREEVAK